MARAGRPSLLTPEMHKSIVGYVANGHSNEDAIKLSGASRTSFYRWIDKGKQQKTGKYRNFWNDLEKAVSDFKESNLARIRAARDEKAVTTKRHVTIVREVKRDASGKPILDPVTNEPVFVIVKRTEDIVTTDAPPQWQTAAWLLERKHPKEFSRKVLELDGSVEVDGSMGVSVEMIFDDGDSEPEPEPDPEKGENSA